MDKHISAMPFAGVTGHGMSVQWDFRFQDGQVQRFVCPAEFLSTLIQGLRLAGQAAEKVRQGMQPQLMDLAYTHQVTAVRSGRSGPDVVLRFSTQPGIPVDLSMTVAVATDTIQQIGIAVGQNISDAPHKH